MRIQELFEQIGTVGTVGSTAMPATAAAPAAAGAMTGNTQALNDPRLAAANLAQQKQQKQKQRQSIMAQIAALNKQMAELNRS